MISISIVSHGQYTLVKDLLADLEKYCAGSIEVILTVNIPEEVPTTLPYSFPIKIIKNTQPKGFGANHNQAFRESTGEYFCVLNPDIRLTSNPFPQLTQHNWGVTAPQIVDENGNYQDNAREFLTPLKLLKRVFTKNKGTMQHTEHPDWVAGMFMVFPRKIYEILQGFDERYYLYCEDMDICWRLHQAGCQITLDKNTKAIHVAQHDSHKKLKFLYWHLKSLWIYFFLHPRQLIRW